jgi:phosphatidylserine decarboxylase
LIFIWLLFSERLLDAWKGTPIRWYPLPLAVGALLLVAIQVRKRLSRTGKEVLVDDDGMEIIKLKGPWQVCPVKLTYV